MNKKSLVGILIIAAVLYYFGFFGTGSLFYGANQVRCSQGADLYALDCSAIGGGAVGSELEAMTSDDIYSLSIEAGDISLLTSKQFGYFTPTIRRDLPQMNSLMDNICKTSGGTITFSSSDLASKCSAAKVCSTSYGYVQGKVDTSYMTCSCSLMPEYSNTLSNLGVTKGSLRDECGGFVESQAISYYWYSGAIYEQTSIYATYDMNINEFMSKNFDNQLMILNGVITDKRDIDSPSVSQAFKTYGLCNMGTGICQVRGIDIDPAKFPQSHVAITSMEIKLKAGGYTEAEGCSAVGCVKGYTSSSSTNSDLNPIDEPNGNVSTAVDPFAFLKLLWERFLTWLNSKY